MQTLVETLNLYNNAFDALCEAQNLVEQLELETRRILNDNTEPITVPTGGDADRNITTPADLECLTPGTVISVNGVEHIRMGYSGDSWADYLGHKLSHHKVFRRMLDSANECEIIHVGN